MITKADWLWQGHAGHFICADRCAFHMATTVGEFLVSTVGEYRSPLRSKDSDPWEEIGYRRLYETMVFKVAGRQADGCAEVADYSEIEMEGYNDSESASAGHMRLCQEMQDKQNQPKAPTAEQECMACKANLHSKNGILAHTCKAKGE